MYKMLKTYSMITYLFHESKISSMTMFTVSSIHI